MSITFIKSSNPSDSGQIFFVTVFLGGSSSNSLRHIQERQEEKSGREDNKERCPRLTGAGGMCGQLSLVRTCESELSEEKEGQQRGRTMLLTMGSD